MGPCPSSNIDNVLPNRILSALLTALLVLSGCTLGPDLHGTVATAREAVLAVRPKVNLDNVQARLLTPSTDLKALVKEDRGGFSLPELRRVIDENAPAFFGLSLLDERDIAELRDEFADLHMADADGVAIYAAGIILIVPRRAGSVETCAHELAHIATARLGYLDSGLRRYFPRTEGRPDPAWVDIDAMIASKLLMEADAQLTARAAVAYKEGGASALSELWRKQVPVDQPKGTGPLKIISPGGAVIVEVGPGEPYYDDQSGTLEALGNLAYGGSVALLLARHQSDQGLEDTLSRVWSEFSYTTREVLYPQKTHKPSRFATAWRSLGNEVLGATRTGAFLVRGMIARKFRLTHEQIIEMTANFEDDAILRLSHGNILWITRWAEAAFADRFATLYQKVLRDGKVETDGDRVIATIGDIPGRGKYLSVLR